MTEPENLVLVHLRRIDEKLDVQTQAIRDLASEIRGIKAHMAAFLQHEVLNDASLASLTLRLERIERRLEINE